MTKDIPFVEPDYSERSHRSGGKVEDMYKPYIFFFDKAKRPREIHVKIMTYAGCVGSNGHYYCDIKEENNSIWSYDGEGKWIWTEPWYSYKIKGIEGRRWDEKFSNINTAFKAIEKQLKKWNVSNKKKYKIIWNNEGYYSGHLTDKYRKAYNKLLKGD